MTQKGTHTWDLILSYHRCPRCGYIMESRQGYEYRLGQYQKDIECERCSQFFTETKKKKPSFGPLIGEDQPIEVDWKERKNDRS